VARIKSTARLVGPAAGFGDEGHGSEGSTERMEFAALSDAGSHSDPVLSNILLKFWVQLHQLTPNAIVQLLKYIWALMNFRGIPSTNGFAKRYELHYQLRKMEVDRVEVQGQYGCLNFHAKHGGQGTKLTVVVKNKWSGAWTPGIVLLQSYPSSGPEPRTR
jgi:hypothetical protein